MSTIHCSKYRTHTGVSINKGVPLERASSLLFSAAAALSETLLSGGWSKQARRLRVAERIAWAGSRRFAWTWGIVVSSVAELSNFRTSLHRFDARSDTAMYTSDTETTAISIVESFVCDRMVLGHKVDETSEAMGD